MIAIADVILRRQAELSQQLAALAGQNPAGILPVIQSLPLDEFIDLQARRFVSALLARLDELMSADNMTQAQVTAGIAFELGLATDYLKWIKLIPVSNRLFSELAADVVKEIKRLRITRVTLENLEDYGVETLEIARQGSGR